MEKGVPFSYTEYKLCERFGWTTQEFYNQPWEKIQIFLGMMNIEAQFQERESLKLKQESQKYAKWRK